MTLRPLLEIVQVIFAVLLVGLISMQSGGGGLTSSLSQAVGMYRSKRGFERFVFVGTVVVSVLFVVNSLAILLAK